MKVVAEPHSSSVHSRGEEKCAVRHPCASGAGRFHSLGFPQPPMEHTTHLWLRTCTLRFRVAHHCKSATGKFIFHRAQGSYPGQGWYLLQDSTSGIHLRNSGALRPCTLCEFAMAAFLALDIGSRTNCPGTGRGKAARNHFWRRLHAIQKRDLVVNLGKEYFCAGALVAGLLFCL